MSAMWASRIVATSCSYFFLFLWTNICWINLIYGLEWKWLRPKRRSSCLINPARFVAILKRYLTLCNAVKSSKNDELIFHGKSRHNRIDTLSALWVSMPISRIDWTISWPLNIWPRKFLWKSFGKSENVKRVFFFYESKVRVIIGDDAKSIGENENSRENNF